MDDERYDLETGPDARKVQAEPDRNAGWRRVRGERPHLAEIDHDEDLYMSRATLSSPDT
jgi:hypothetical protein